jgi:iron complex transport system substrate-binding protein
MLCACSPREKNTAPEGPNAAPQNAAIEITDSYGRLVQLSAEPRRIVSLAPNITETLFLLGAGNLLAGRTDYCDYPPEVLSIPSVGSITEPSIEKIISLKPDLVVGSTHFQKETLAALENVNIPVYVGVIRSSYEEIFTMITALGRITGKDSQAADICAAMRQKIHSVESAVQKAAKKPRVYYMISCGDAGDYTAGRGTFISALINSAGGVNAGDDIEGWRYSVEALFHNEPDIILCSSQSGGSEKLKTPPPYNRLRALAAGRVYEIASDLIDRIGPRNIEGLEMLAKIFYPELFP